MPRATAVAAVVLLLAAALAFGWWLGQRMPGPTATSPSPATPAAPEVADAPVASAPAPDAPIAATPTAPPLAPEAAPLEALPHGIVGTVTDVQGAPIADALVQAALGQIPAKQATTDASGAFRLRALRDDEYILTVEHPDYDTAQLAGLRPGAPPQRVRLAPKGRVTGRVIDALTRAPLPHFALMRSAAVHGGDEAFLRASFKPSAAWLPVESADGQFALGQISATRPVSIAVRAPGYAPAWQTAALNAPGETLALGDIALTRGGTISVQVEDAAGVPLPGAQVLVLMGQKAFAQFETDDTGHAAAEHLLPGEYTVRGNKRAHGAAEERVTLRAGGSASLSLRLGPPAEIVGTVYWGTHAIPGARVSAGRYATALSAITSETDAEGRYRLKAAEEGRLMVEALLPPELAAPLNRLTQLVEVSPGLESRADFYFPEEAATLVGIVRQGGAPASGVEVMVYPQAEGTITPERAVTGDDGRFTLALAPGAALVVARADAPHGMLQQSQEAALAAGQTTEVNFDFSGQARMSVQVTNLAPGEAAEVLLVPAGIAVDLSNIEALAALQPYFAAARATVVAPGTADFMQLTPGRYTVGAVAWSGNDFRQLRSTTASIALAAGENPALVLRLP